MTGAARDEAGGGLRTLEIDSLAVGGDGVAREESGRVVFVPRTAPGDRVRVRLVREEDSYARGEVEEILDPGSHRRDAPCPYYEGCGSCQLQHLGGEAERRAKRGMVEDALRRIGGREVEVGDPVASPREFRYRNRVTFTLRRGREGVRAGYHRRSAPDRIVDVDACPLAEEPIQRAWRQLRGAWGDDAERMPGGRSLRVGLRASAEGRISLTVEEETAGERGGPGDPEAIAGAVDRLSGYFWRRDGRRRRLAGASRMEEEWQGVSLRLPPEVFLQVNRGMADIMERHLDRRIRERLGGARGLRILDLYAGVGLRGLRWREDGADAAGCELDPEAVRAGREAASRRDSEWDLRAEAVEDALPALLPADLAVVNPPRAGLSSRVSSLLRDASLDALAYVSCDPATLARDLDRLGPSWRIRSVRPFDAFPQTAHVETIVWLERDGDGRSGRGDPPGEGVRE